MTTSPALLQIQNLSLPKSQNQFYINTRRRRMLNSGSFTMAIL